MGDSALARAARRVEARPFASLVLCVMLLAIQLGSWPILFLIAVAHNESGTVSALLQVPMVLWILLPAGSLYGLRLATRPAAAEHGTARVLGLIANGLYLLFGICMWLMVLTGVRV